MLSWLLVIIVAYFFFALSSLGDKLILAGPPKPNSYIFFVGISNIALIALLPFTKFSVPSLLTFFWIVSEAFVFTAALYLMYSAIEKFEISKVAATIGATQPVFIFLIGWLLWKQAALTGTNLLAFGLLLLGNIIISMGKSKKQSWEYLKLTLFASLLFSFDYIFTKIVFLSQPFLMGFIWMRFFAFLLGLLLLLSKRNRKDIFAKKNFLNKKMGSIFAFSWASGGAANLLQAFAISLAPVAFLPILNSLRGVQYIFLFIMILALSIFVPKILKEEISKKIIFKKTATIFIIAAGLALLVF